MINLINDINDYILQKDDKKYLLLIFFGIILTIILETISIASIIPIFNIVILEKLPLANFLNLQNFKLDTDFKLLALSIFVIIFLVKNLFIILFNFFFINYICKLNIGISNRLFNSCLRQDYNFFLKGKSKNFLHSVTDDVNHVNGFLLSFINILIEFFFVLAISFYLISINYKIYLFCFIIFFLTFFFYFKVFKERIEKWSIQYWNSTSKVKNLVIEGVNGIKDLIVYKLHDYFFNSFKAQTYLSYKSKSRIDFLNNVQKYWLEMVTISAMICSLFYFIFFDLNINSLIPIFGVFAFALFRLLSSFNRIILHGQNIRFFYPSFLSIVNLFKSFEKYNESFVDKDFQFCSKLEFKNVSFSYDEISGQVFKNVNLEIKKGDCIGILGKNASGKSTFLNLISALIEPSQGEILVDRKYSLYPNRSLWNKNLSYIQQNIFLLDSSIKNNICLEEENKIDYVKFNKIVNDLELNIFFKDHPNLLNTKVGINGLNLSGGQKQIISLARALYKKNVDVIILDEPSSALDTANTELLKKILLQFKTKKTIFMVTHDQNSFSDCFDKIIEIELGKIIYLKK
jgi:ABC-type multidrug transport system fused ATPase/permease subunit